jgi:hypothetical protein
VLHPKQSAPEIEGPQLELLKHRTLAQGARESPCCRSVGIFRNSHVVNVCNLCKELVAESRLANVCYPCAELVDNHATQQRL